MARAKIGLGYVPDMGSGQIKPLGTGTAQIGGSSNIGASGPFTAGHMAQYGQPKPAARQYGGGSGDRSRDAFAQAGAQQAGNAYMQQMEDANRAYRTGAEQARSADVFSQRQDAARRYGLNESYKADRRGINLAQREDLRNMRNRLEEQKRNTDLEYRHNLLNLVAGGGALSAMGNAWTAYNQGAPGAAAGRSGGVNPYGTGSGVLGGILGGVVGGPGGALLGATAGNATGRLLSGLFA